MVWAWLQTKKRHDVTPLVSFQAVERHEVIVWVRLQITKRHDVTPLVSFQAVERHEVTPLVSFQAVERHVGVMRALVAVLLLAATVTSFSPPGKSSPY